MCRIIVCECICTASDGIERGLPCWEKFHEDLFLERGKFVKLNPNEIRFF